ncbi:MAG TPA: VacJ family lipoprotein [Stellaceae bacterium]|nr:VacJ family lipoprotein [Stellaceae bacterium]
MTKDYRIEPPRSRAGFALLLVVLFLPLLAACATPPTDPAARADYDARNDPIEPTNRDVFAVDQFVDKNAMQPVAQAYRDYVPVVVQHRLHDLLANLQDPVIEINDLLQGNFARGWVTFQRFAINSTIGGLGLFDVATDWDLPYHDADYGQTLAVWGIADGPYVVLPILGPSNVRDAVGTGMGFFLDPLGFVGGNNAFIANLSRGVANGIDDRADNLDTLKALEDNSLDFYATLRSAYRQHRQHEVAEALGKADQPEGGSSVTLGEPGLVDP